METESKEILEVPPQEENTSTQLADHILAIGVIFCIWGWIYWPFLRSLPAGVDFGAHLFRLAYISENGLNSEWNGLWYAGTAFLEVYPPNTTFFLWLIDIFFSINESYVIFLAFTHLLIAIGVYWVGITINRSVYSSVLASLFIMTLPSLNSSFMFYSRAPTHIGVALFFFCLALYYSEKRYSAVALACLLSLTHFMMFGFFIIVIICSEIVKLGRNLQAVESAVKRRDFKLIKPILKESAFRMLIWGIPFIWVITLMATFFSEPIGLIMVSRTSFSQFTDGPDVIYHILRVLRSFIDHYITRDVFLLMLLFGFSIVIKQFNHKELGMILAGVLITITGFLLFYQESNVELPLFLRGMDVLRFVLTSQMLILLITIRGINQKRSLVVVILILLLPIAEAQNGISNYGYLQFDDNHWNTLNPLVEDLNEREGFFYVCPYHYQGDFIAYLPALTGKPYFDGWNPPGCRLSWFQDTPPNSTKYRPNATIIQDVANDPNKYGVKWMITNKGQGGLPATNWRFVSRETNQSKWLYESKIPISLVDVTPFGNGTLTYSSANKLRIEIESNVTIVNVLIKVAHHPGWKIQDNPSLLLTRETEVGFMSIENVSNSNLVLVFKSNQVDILFASFIVNLLVIIVLIPLEYGMWERMKKFYTQYQTKTKK